MLSQSLFLTVFTVGSLAQQATLTSSGSITPSAQTTATLFLPPEATADGFRATVIHADSCATTYGFVCTSGSFGGTIAYCEPSLTPRVTYLGSSSLTVSTQSTNGGAMQTFIEACDIHGTTKAVCRRTYGVSGSGIKATSWEATTTMSRKELVFAQIPITAGAQKLKDPAKSCVSPLTTTSSGAAAPTLLGEVYKVFVPGAAALIVGALA